MRAPLLGGLILATLTGFSVQAQGNVDFRA